MTGLRTRLEESAAALRSVFANPALRRLQLAWAGSVFGQWFYAVALGVYAFQADGAGGVALVAFVRFGLGALLAPFSSLLGDRLPRRAVMVGADLVRAGAMAIAALGVALDGSPLVVYAMAVVVTVSATAYHPAEAALLPDLARSPDELASANVVSGTLANLAGLAGPALGGLLYAATGADVVFAVTAVTFLWSAALLVRLPRGARPTSQDEASGAGGVLRAALAGFAQVGRDGRLRVIIGLYAASALTWGVLSVAIVVIALQDLGLGEQGLGYLLGAASVGGLVGAVVAAVVASTRRLAWGLGLGTLVWGLPLVGMAAVLEPWTALVAFGVLGVGEALIEVTTMTLLQRAVPDEVRARVFGVLESLTVGAIALGGAIAAPMLSGLGARGTLLCAGLAMPVLALVVWPRLTAIDRAAAAPEAELALLRAIPLFAPLPVPVLEGLAGRLGSVSAAAGETIVREGEPGELFYVVASGALSVTQGDQELRTLGPGDFFGEIALLRSVPRTATVTATAASGLRTLGREEFVAAVTGHAPSRAAADAVVDARLGVRGTAGVT